MASFAIHSLYKSFGSVKAVQDLSFEVHPGQVHGLLGPNGSGKTTTLCCALGLMRPTKGSIEVLGVSSRALHRTAGRLGVVFDQPVLLKRRSVAANLAYHAKIRGHKGGRTHDEVLKLVGLSDLKRRRAGALSLGQGKRLALAVALAGDPELVVLDEPLSGLDPVGTREILALISKLATSGLTLILSTHRLHDVEPVLTHATIMVRGRRVATGPLSEILGRGEGLLQATVQDPKRALKALAAMGGWQVCSEEGSVINVDLGSSGAQPSELAEVLVKAGAGLVRLQPAGQRLADAFDRLVAQESTPE
jgi:ABC-2 type transport system ATP-binding protein